MAKEKMTLDKASKIASNLAAATVKWGKHASVNYTESEIYDAVRVLNDAVSRKTDSGKEEITKLRRQLAACQNREKARTGKGDLQQVAQALVDDETDVSVT